MFEDLNLIRNWRFRDGVRRPRSWTWSASGEGVLWCRSAGPDSPHGELVVTSHSDDGTGVWTQRFRCSGKQWYRIEVEVTCVCEGDHEHSGAGLWVCPILDGEPAAEPTRLAGALRSTGPVTLRSYYRTPPKVRSIEVRVGLFRVCGSITLHSVSAVPILEPEATCHILTLPPPPYAYPAPRTVRKIGVCDERGAERPLVSILAKRFGRRSVVHVQPSDLPAGGLKVDALILSGPKPPKRLRSLSALIKLASRYLIVVSPEAFAKIVGGGLIVRTIEQADDPMHAKVRWANFITRGFALHDAFPFASKGSDPHAFAQRQLRKGPRLTRLRKEHQFETILQSQTDTEATSGQPICLYKAVEGGGIVVFDTDPVETLPSTCDECNLAAYVLFNMLGADQSSLSQYVVPEETEGDWFKTLKEFALRYPMFRFSGSDRHDGVLQVGIDEDTFGLPMTPRPAILIRTGLRGDDLAGVYGTLVYLKNLVRAEPYETPYARKLLSRFRLAWVPLCGPWQPRHWDASLAAQRIEATGQFEREAVAAVIDITESPTRDLRIVYERRDADHERQERLLKALARRFAAGRYFYRAPAPGLAMSRRDEMSWGFETLVPKVVVDPSPFCTELHRSAAAAGARLIRIEIPGANTSFVCNSIWRTDLAATTLEHVIGLQYGLVAMNRTATPVPFENRPPIRPGEAICIPADQTVGLSMRAG